MHNQSHNFNKPSHPHVITLLGSVGCHSTPMHTFSWAYDNKWDKYLYCSIVGCCFPIPEEYSAFSITGCQELSISWKCNTTSISSRYMTSEILLSIHSEVTGLSIIDTYLGIYYYYTRLLLYYPTQFWPVGFTDVAVTACISGSLICLITTGIPNSQMNNFLSSELDTNLRL